MNKIIIGTRIRYERQKAGLTLEELGNKVGVSKQCLSGWEHGRNMPDVVTLYRMSKLFDITIEDFLFELPDTAISAPNKSYIVNHNTETVHDPSISSLILSPKEEILIHKYRALSTERRKAVEVLYGIRTSNLI